MARFLNTAGAYSEIENIITNAENRLVLISPYIQIPGMLLERLTHATEKRGVNIYLVCRKEDLNRNEINTLKKIDRLEILNLPNVHAKCFFNENSMVITSLNLYEYSQINNREMGLLITREEDTSAFFEAKSEAEFIIQTASVIKVNRVLDWRSGSFWNFSQPVSTYTTNPLHQPTPIFADKSKSDSTIQNGLADHGKAIRQNPIASFLERNFPTFTKLFRS